MAFFLPSLDGGGAERSILNLAIGFSQRGFEVHLVLAKATGAYLAAVTPGVAVVDLKVSRVLKAIAPLAAYLRHRRPSVLLAALDHANLIALAASRLAGARTRTVISFRNTLHYQIRGRTDVCNRLIPGLLGRFHHLADAIVAVSEGVADHMASATLVPRARIEVIYNPVITPALLAAAREHPGHSWFELRDRPIILGVGRLVPVKNFGLLIDAFARVRRVHHGARLVIIGEGPDRPALEAQVRRLGLNGSVALPGFLNNPYSCMASASIVVHPSNSEGLPAVLIESLAVGTPVVATDCETGPREILRGGALGELVPVGDVDALAAAIGRTLANPRPPPSAEHLHRYTLEESMDQFERVFRLGV